MSNLVIRPLSRIIDRNRMLLTSCSHAKPCMKTFSRKSMMLAKLQDNKVTSGSVNSNPLRDTADILAKLVESKKNQNVLPKPKKSKRRDNDIFALVPMISKCKLSNDAVQLLNSKGLLSKGTEPMVKDVENPDFVSIAIDHNFIKQLCSGAVKQINGPDYARSFAINVLEDHIAKEDTKKKEEIVTFIDNCFIVGMPNKALAFAARLHKNWQNQNLDPDIYNQILLNYGDSLNYGKQKNILRQMQKQRIKPTWLSFAALLKGLGQYSPLDKDKVSEVISQMKNRGMDVAYNPIDSGLTYRDIKLINRALSSQEDKALRLQNKHLLSGDYICPLLKDFRKDPKEQINPSFGLLTDTELKSCLKQQISLQSKDPAYVASIVAPRKPAPHTKKGRTLLTQLFREWRVTLMDSFIAELKVLRSKKPSTGQGKILPYLNLMKPEEYVDVMMSTINTQLADYGPNLGKRYYLLGDKLQAKCHDLHRTNLGLNTKIQTAYAFYLDEVNKPTLTGNHREIFVNILKDNDALEVLDMSKAWPEHLVRAVGKFLYGILIAELKIDQNIMKPGSRKNNVPAFHIIYRHTDLKWTTNLKCNTVLTELLHRASKKYIPCLVGDLPSVVPPLPWCSHSFGVDAKNPVRLVRRCSDLQQRSLENKEDLLPCKREELWPCLDALNALSAVPWRINEQILDIAMSIFRNGGDEAYNIPLHQSGFPSPLPLAQAETQKERMKILHSNYQLIKDKAEAFSLWCTELYKLSIANHYRGKVFWLGHNVDFRSRAYTVSTHLTHIGPDLSRSLLKFAIGKPLGPNGLDWLKIHLINLTSLKKRSSNKERLEFANTMMDDILDSADNPLTGNKWWASCEDLWQVLSVCFEIASAVRSPNPEEYSSHLPIHQDGSCNGLQHYAALGRDEAGAKSVNLFPLDLPADVYSDVVALVEKERQQDAANGLEIAKILEGFIKRKTVKQTIMTTVYGVTEYGAKQQIRRQLNFLEDFPSEHLNSASKYLGSKTFHCLRQVFHSARSIQDWFVASAHFISKRNEVVSWKTPLGFPVVQMYKLKKNLLIPLDPQLDKLLSMARKRVIKAECVHLRV